MKKTRKRRSEAQLIADLEAEVARLKTQARAKKLKKDPSLRHVNAAVRAIDKAHGSTKDAATRQALEEARATLSACLALHTGGEKGVIIPHPRSRGASGGVDQADLLAYVRAHPGSRGEQIAAALGTDTKTMRPVMRRLIQDGKVSTHGERRGMTYSPA